MRWEKNVIPILRFCKSAYVADKSFRTRYRTPVVLKSGQCPPGLTQHLFPLMTDTIKEVETFNENRRKGSIDDQATLTANIKTEDEKKGSTEVEGVIPLPQDYPDGGLAAWLTVLGGVCTTAATFGFVNSYVCHAMKWHFAYFYNLLHRVYVAFFMRFISLHFIFLLKVFQAYYSETLLPHISPSSL